VADQPSINRLRWLCRRGMLELDAWLTRFLDSRYADLPAEQQAVFVSLLDQDDMALFDWITGACASPAEFRGVVEEIKIIRHTHQQR
jgi:antitoxin CptB